MAQHLEVTTKIIGPKKMPMQGISGNDREKHGGKNVEYYFEVTSWEYDGGKQLPGSIMKYYEYYLNPR